MATPFQFKSVKTRIVFWLLLISTLPLILTEVTTYNRRIEDVKARALQKLEAVLTIKTQVVENWLHERSSSVRNIAGTREMEDLEHVFGTGNMGAERQELIFRAAELLENSARNYLDYEELFVVDPGTGRIEISSNPKNLGMDSSALAYFTEPLRKRTVHVHGIYYSNVKNKPSLTFSAPIFSHLEPSVLVAVLVARIDLENSFYPLLLNREGMGETGETLLVNKEGLVLSPLRWKENAPLREKIDAQPARLAALGETGAIESQDYRSVQVLAAFGSLESTGWGIVAKQDLSEIDEALREIARQSWGLMAGAALGALVLALLLGRTFARPIQELSRVARQLEGGNHDARNRISRSDEIGFLAESFNAMADAVMHQMAVQKGSAEISNAMTAARELDEFASTLLRQLVRLTGSNLGAFYLASDDGQTFTPLSSLGVQQELLSEVDAASLEGDFGLALVDKKISVLASIPPDTIFSLKTFVGTALPRQIMTIPILVEGQVKALVSLASLQEYDTSHLELVEHSWVGMRTAFSNLLANLATSRLAADLRESNEELASANEELQSQAEELRSQAEELKVQAEELEVKRREVEQTDRLKSEFLSNMSHELRTPLNSVMALSQLMIARGTGRDLEQDASYLKVIDRNARHLLHLINDILDLSKIEAGRMDIYWGDLPPRLAIDEALEAVRPLADAKGLALDVVLGELPELYSDPDKVHQILLNLFSNAVKFTESGSVRVRVQQEGDDLRFCVTDTGIGIGADDLEHIFDEFRQVDGSVTRRFEGTGLGLAISRKLARMLGGDIEVESRKGQGSTFVLVLPRRPSPLVAETEMMPRPLPAAVSAAPEPVPRTERTILVIDDDPEVRSLVQSHLENEGYGVMQAASGREGLELAQKWDFHAITLDVMMPELDGWEVIRRLKASDSTRDVPVIMLTVSDDRETGLALGANGYITKPVERRVLLREIEKLGTQRAVRKLLVIEDSPVDRLHLERLLESSPYRLQMAEGGRQGMELMLADPPDALLLDLMMEGMDGFKVLEAMRANPVTRHLPVLVLTAKDLGVSEREILDASAQKVVSKGMLDRQSLLRELGLILGALPLRKGEASEAGPLILVVEDNPVAALQLKTALLDAGFRVNLASGGAEGLESVAKHLPDAIVLDLMMPDVDGFEVLEQVRSTARSATLPVLVLTAKEITAQDRSRLSHNNIQQLIQKGSLDREQLIGRVRALLKQYAPPVSAALRAPEAAVSVMISTADILVVEDNPDNLLTLGAILDDAGYSYRSVTDGQQAVDAVHSCQPELVLMDMQLPVLSGIDATRQIKSDPRFAGIPIVALTARAMKGDREEILAAGCDDYLSKPLDPVLLVETLRRWLPGE